jgi:HKD family nuclease
MKKFSTCVLLLVLLMLAACATDTQPTPAPTVAPTVAAPLASPAPVANCPCLKVYALPEVGIKVVMDAIDGAQKSVRLKMYLFTEPQMVEALRRAAQRKVDVKILMELNPFGGGTSNLDIYNALKDSGVQWKWSDREAYRFTHEKSLVIDDKVAYIMTHNFTTSSFLANREYGVIDTHPADVTEIVRVFDADWNRQKPDLSNARLVWSPVNARQRILALLDEAKTSIDLEQAEMLDAEIGDHLLAAIKRGVKVRLVSSAYDPIEKDNNELQKEALRRAGAEVRYQDEPYVHAKMYLIDNRKAFIGSENNSTNSLNNNRELGIIFDEVAAIVTVAQTFEKDFAKGTKEPFPKGDTPIPPSGVVDAKDAAKYYNRTVTVEGVVMNIYKSERVIWLIMGANREKDMKAVIFPQDWPKFPDLPDKLFANKKIRVTGRVEKYLDAPEIIVRDPKAIEVVK